MPTNLLHLHKILKNNHTAHSKMIGFSHMDLKFLSYRDLKVAADSSSLIFLLNKIFKQFSF